MREVLYECERNPVCLVQEYGVLLDEVVRVGEEGGDFTGTYRSVPYPERVDDTSVFFPSDLVVDVSGVGCVLLADEVHRGVEVSVVDPLVFQNAVGSEPVISEGEVQRRENVLGREDVEVRFLTFGIGEECSPIRQLRVRGLGVVHRKGRRGVAVDFQRLVEGYSFAVIPLEEVVGLGGGADDSEISGADIVPHERIIVEPIVVRRVHRMRRYLIEIRISRPGYDPLVFEGIGESESFEYSGSVLPYRIPYREKAVFDGESGIDLALPGRHLLFEVVFLACVLVE